MTENREETVRAARDWAHSIQARFAEQILGEFARETDADPKDKGDHWKKVEEAARANGISPAELRKMRQERVVEKEGEFDEPLARAILEDRFAELDTTIQMMGDPSLSERIIISSLPSGAVSALCCKNSWDPFVHIFVDSDLAVFCNSVSKIVLTCIVSKTRFELLCREEMLLALSNNDVDWWVRNLFHSAVFHGTVRASEPFLTDPSLALRAVTLGSAQQRFVLAHELGHMVLGHIDNDEAMNAIEAPGLANADVLLFSRQAEFDADRYGVLIGTSATKLHHGTIFDFTGSYIFMMAVHVLEMCKAMVGTGDGGIDSTHPPAKERAAAIRSILRDLAGPEIEPVLDRLDQLFFYIGRIALAETTMLLIKGVKPRERIMLRVYEQGERPAILGAFDIEKLRSEAEAISAQTPE